MSLANDEDGEYADEAIYAAKCIARLILCVPEEFRDRAFEAFTGMFACSIKSFMALYRGDAEGVMDNCEKARVLKESVENAIKLAHPVGTA